MKRVKIAPTTDYDLGDIVLIMGSLERQAGVFLGGPFGGFASGYAFYPLFHNTDYIPIGEALAKEFGLPKDCILFFSEKGKPEMYKPTLIIEDGEEPESK